MHPIVLIALVVAAMALSACGGSEPTAVPSPTVQPSPTRLSDPLPTLAPAPRVGSAERPINMVMLGPARSTDRSEDAAGLLAEWLSWGGDPADFIPTPVASATPASTAQESATPDAPAVITATPDAALDTGVSPDHTVTVTLRDTYAEAIELLCRTDDPVIAWLDAWSYLVVEEMDCATPRYLVEVRQGRRTLTSTPGSVIIYNNTRWVPALGGRPVRSADDLQSPAVTLCRLAYDDPAEWRLPALTLMANGVDPFERAADILVFDDLEDLVREVYDVQAGQCGAAVVPADWADVTLDDTDDLEDLVEELETAVEVPNPVMVYANTVPLDARNHIDDALDVILEDDDSPARDALKLLLGADDLALADADDFEDFREFVGDAGIDPLRFGE